jgi:transcriptional regulator with XRE-family HTH domain
MQASVREDNQPRYRDGAARTFAELLYRHRLAAGLSRLELADRVLCSEKYIYRLESRDAKHRRVPTPWLVRALSDALQLNPEQGEALLRARDRLDRDSMRGSARSLVRAPTAHQFVSESNDSDRTAP